VKGHYLTTPEFVCHGCDKLSGLDDFVATALQIGVHDRAFMVAVLMSEAQENPSSPRLLRVRNYILATLLCESVSHVLHISFITNAKQQDEYR
jgi:hypothetical protein